jgi:uncharacterized RDD family membrane protein YckC
MEKAGFFSRLVAYLIDGFLVAIVAGILSWLILMLVGGATIDQNSSFIGIFTGSYLIIWLVTLVLVFLYFGYFWSASGSSLGMRVVNIKVIRRTEGEAIDFVRAGLRGTFGYWVSGFIFGLGFWWALFDAQKETWHDKIFDTWVVKS